MIAGAVAAADPTLSADSIRQWWDAVPDGWKIAVLVLALVLLVVGMVKRLFVLTLVSALVAGGLLAWWWWSTR